MSATSISRRVESSIKSYLESDCESTLIHLFPALDKTAKRRRPRDGVGKRIRAFLEDELDIITYFGAGFQLRGVKVRGMSIPDAVYKFGRTSIAHEGELDDRLNFDNNSGIKIDEVWNLPPTFIIGLLVSVIVAPENKDESFNYEYKINIGEDTFITTDLWGKKEEIYQWVEDKINESKD